MNTYLAIITTVLVITQIIRVTQNHIQLRRQQKQFEKDLAWVMETDITKKDFEIQREATRLLLKKLQKEEEMSDAE